MPTISLDQAREEVWSRLFASKCIKLTQEQWDMIFALQHSDRVPRKLQPRLERALLLREQLNQQLYEADKWLRLHVENYDVVPVHSTNAEAPTGGLTSGATRWQANIAAVLIDSGALHIALSSAFGEDDQRRPLSDSDMESMLRGYLSTTEPIPGRGTYALEICRT